MNGRKQYAGIDYFRVAAAFLIVAIHTGPLEKISAAADYLFTYCVGRVAVPFFLMVTGYFVLAGLAGKGGARARRRLVRYLVRMLLLYVGVTLLYLPISIYAGNLPAGFGGLMKWFWMDGSFYHLWYLPALLLGSMITAILLHYCPPAVSGAAVGLLYVIGLLGDSYYGIVSRLEPVKGFYEAIFAFSSYTRNGLFFAPVFLWMGAMLGARAHRADALCPVEDMSESSLDGTEKSENLSEFEGTGEKEPQEKADELSNNKNMREEILKEETEVPQELEEMRQDEEALPESEEMQLREMRVEADDFPEAEELRNRKQVTAADFWVCEERMRQSVPVPEGNAEASEPAAAPRAGAGGRRIGTKVIWAGFAVSLLCMLTEGFLTWHFEVQRHNSMYIFLIPVMLFLMEGLLRIPGKAPAMLRTASMWIYLLHPLCIVAVRGAAKLVKAQTVLVDNQLVFWILVCIASCAAAFILCQVTAVVRRKRGKR